MADLETDLFSLENPDVELMHGLCSDWVRRDVSSVLLAGNLPLAAFPHGRGGTEHPEGFCAGFEQKTERASLKDTEGTITSVLSSVARATALGEPGREVGRDPVGGLHTGGLGNLWHTEGQDGGKRTLETGGTVTGRVPEISPSKYSISGSVSGFFFVASITYSCPVGREGRMVTDLGLKVVRFGRASTFCRDAFSR